MSIGRNSAIEKNQFDHRVHKKRDKRRRGTVLLNEIKKKNKHVSKQAQVCVFGFHQPTDPEDIL